MKLSFCKLSFGAYISNMGFQSGFQVADADCIYEDTKSSDDNFWDFYDVEKTFLVIRLLVRINWRGKDDENENCG